MKLEICDVSKKFRNAIVLENINLTLEEGQVYGLEGRNGSGKSVLLKIICGLYAPTNGTVLYNNQNWNTKEKCPLRIRATIDKPSFFPTLSGYENLKLLSNIEKSIDDKDILKALEIVGLTDDKNKKFSKYSLGMKQKLGIAQAIMEKSDILILDEPFNGIDEESKKSIKEYIKQLKKNKNQIIIITSHIHEDLTELCDSIIHIKGGMIKDEISTNS